MPNDTQHKIRDAADDLRKLAEAYPRVKEIVELPSSKLEYMAVECRAQLLDLAAKLYAENERAREIFMKAAHVPGRGDSLDWKAVNEWLAKHARPDDGGIR